MRLFHGIAVGRAVAVLQVDEAQAGQGEEGREIGQLCRFGRAKLGLPLCQAMPISGWPVPP